MGNALALTLVAEDVLPPALVGSNAELLAAGCGAREREKAPCRATDGNLELLAKLWIRGDEEANW